MQKNLNLLWVSIQFPMKSRDWWQKFATSIFVHKSKTINDRVKSQARGQNYCLRALKWGIVHLCNSKSTGDMIKNKKYHF